MDWGLVVLRLVLGAVIGFSVLCYLVNTNKLKPPFKRPAESAVELVLKIVPTFLLLLFGGALAVAVVVGAYKGADEAGWLPHQRTISVWMPRDWLVGEFKTCVLDEFVKNIVLSCGDSNTAPHDMNVEFRGSLDALESHKQSNWTCQRKTESITCKAN
jgi:hypothetical protein